MQRQAGKYDAVDLEDRYETRLRAIIEAKLKGEGIEAETPEIVTSNGIDLMAALKKSLGPAPAEPASPKRKKASDSRQAGMKLPIKGGKVAAEEAEKTAARPARKLA